MKPRVLTPNEEDQFDKYKSECVITQIRNSKGILVGESYLHPSQRMQLTITPENMTRMIKSGQALFNKDGNVVISCATKS
jgi:hypothetical protein